MTCGRRALALAGILATAAAGGCADEEGGVITVATATEATTVTTTVVTSQTVTETVAAEPGAAEGAEAAGDELRFSGNGDRSLPPIRVRRGGATLRWRNDGEVFSLFDREGTLVDSVGARGETFLAGGVHRIDVVASGDWLISIPRARLAR